MCAVASAAATGATRSAPNAEKNERLPESVGCCVFDDSRRRRAAGFESELAARARSVDDCAFTRADRLIRGASGHLRGRVCALAVGNVGNE